MYFNGHPANEISVNKQALIDINKREEGIQSDSIITKILNAKRGRLNQTSPSDKKGGGRHSK